MPGTLPATGNYKLSIRLPLPFLDYWIPLPGVWHVNALSGVMTGPGPVNLPYDDELAAFLWDAT